MNDADRQQWVENDEGLYDMWRRSRQPIRAWIRENRKELDRLIAPVIEGTERAHYLKYGSHSRANPRRRKRR